MMLLKHQLEKEKSGRFGTVLFKYNTRLIYNVGVKNDFMHRCWEFPDSHRSF